MGLSLYQRLSNIWKLSANNNKPTQETLFNKVEKKKRMLQAPVYTYRSETSLSELRMAIYMAQAGPDYNRLPLLEIYNNTLTFESQTISQRRTRKNGTSTEKYTLINEATGEIDTEKSKLIQQPWFEDLIGYMLDLPYFDYIVVELHHKAGKVLSAKLIPHENINPQNEAFLPDPINPQARFPIDISPFAIALGNKNGLGLLSTLSYFATFKGFSLPDWARYNEKFGSPFTSLHTDVEEETELLKRQQALANFGSNGWALLDKGDILNFHETNKTNPHITFLEMLKYADEQISKLIVGQTMTADNGSSKSQGEVHERILHWYAEEDMRMISRHMNSKILPYLINEAGLPLEGLKFEWEFFLQKAKANEQAKSTLTILNPFQKACC